MQSSRSFKWQKSAPKKILPMHPLCTDRGHGIQWSCSYQTLPSLKKGNVLRGDSCPIWFTLLILPLRIKFTPYLDWIPVPEWVKWSNPPVGQYNYGNAIPPSPIPEMEMCFQTGKSAAANEWVSDWGNGCAAADTACLHSKRFPSTHFIL